VYILISVLLAQASLNGSVKIKKISLCSFFSEIVAIFPREKYHNHIVGTFSKINNNRKYNRNKIKI
jgi:hypothetical protein